MIKPLQKSGHVKCPGQNTQFWKPQDIFEIKCLVCGNLVEFFKDDITRYCEQCASKINNPKLDLGCENHCSFSEKCRLEKG